MKKRLLAVLTAAVMIVTSAVSVFADSKETEVSVPLKDYRATSIETTEDYQTLKATQPEVTDLIDQINAGTKTVADIPGVNVGTKKAITKVFDLIPLEAPTMSPDGTKYMPTVLVNALTENMTGIEALHYSMDRNVWEQITPDKVDYANKTITLQFEDLSPVVFIANVKASATETSPKTGVAETSTIILIAGVAVLGTAVVLSRKRRRA